MYPDSIRNADISETQMNLPRSRALAARIAAAGTFADQSASEPDDVTITLPDDLSTLADDEIVALRDQVIEAFNSLKAEPQSQASVETLKQLRDATAVLNAELTTRAELAEAIAAEIAAMDAEINGAPQGVDADAQVEEPVAAAAATETFAGAVPDAPAAPAGGDATPAKSVPADVVVKAGTAIADAAKGLVDAANGNAPAPAAAAAADVATFSQKPLVGKVMPKMINVGNLAARTANRTAAVAAASGPAEIPTEPLFSAAINVPGLAPGQALTMLDVATAFDNSMRGASNTAIKAAMRGGERFSQRYPIAQLRKPSTGFAEIAQGTEVTPDYPAIFAARDVSRLPEKSLVASGGWCAPSETIYDLCKLESTDGLISLPEVNVARGGIRFTQGPDWALIFDSTGFCFTEADDIAGTYFNNEVQTITEGGSGLTSFTLTYTGGAATKTTVSIPASATVAQIQAALETLSNIGPNNVYVSGPAAASTGPWTVEFVNADGGTNVPQMTATPTGGSGTVTITTTNAGDAVVSGKPCDTIPCPPFTDVRLNVCGVCITGANLQNVAYPELTARYISGALTAHAHRIATQVIASMITQSDPYTWTGPTNDLSTTAPVLEAIEYHVEDMKYKRRLSRGQEIEAVFPFWLRAAIRADLSRRQGSDLDQLLGVTDADVTAWFASRGVNAQFVYNWQNLGGGTAASQYPATVQFLLYPAGTFVKGTQDVINLEMLHDSTLNSTNNFTAIFTEEAWSVMKMCQDARVITVAICNSGSHNAGVAITCSGGGG